jgi:predicted MPP superfamily phosphohydrolase
MKLTRREFLKVVTYGTVGFGITTLGGYAYATSIEPNWLDLERVNIPIQGLQPALEGVRIAVLSDIHLHPFTGIELVKEAVEVINDLNPDLMVLLGDYVLESANAIFELAPVLANLKSQYGVYAILGNHDLWTDAETVKSGFHQVGIPMLVNSGKEIAINGEKLYLAGLDDGWSGKPDLETALAACPVDVPVILLMHEPDFIDIFAQDARVTLQLSGHTHGGQVRPPGFGSIILPQYGRNYAHGLYQVKSAWLYVTRGLGVIGPPVRFNCRPEITEITLIDQPS